MRRPPSPWWLRLGNNANLHILCLREICGRAEGCTEDDMSRTGYEWGMRHLRWPELRERYARAETIEERFGLIHATRTAINKDDAEEWMRKLRAERDAVAFLTAIGDEHSPLYVEPPPPELEPQLRREARIVLARSFVRDWIPDQYAEPTPETDRDRDPGDTVGGDLGWGTSPGSKLRREIIRRLVRFYSITAQHCDGLDDKGRARVRSFIKTRWEWQRSNECQFISRDELLRATMCIGAFELLGRYGVLDAIPLLYTAIADTLNAVQCRWRRPLYPREIRGDEDRNIALIVCAEVLDPYTRARREPGIDHVRQRARVILELLAQYARKHSEPAVAQTAVAP